MPSWCPDEVAAEVRDLLHRVDLSGVTGGPPMPDMFVYTFEVPGRAPVQVPEQQLTDELRDLARLVLPGPPGQEG